MLKKASGFDKTGKENKVKKEVLRRPLAPLNMNKNTLTGKRKLGGKCKKEKKFIRRHWTQEEDTAIAQLIKRHGIKKWSLIAKKLAADFGIIGRSGKQCRERWHNYLDPELSKNPITSEEERTIFMGQRKYGNKWVEIAKLLSGRRDNLIKNHFYSTLRRQLRKTLKDFNIDMKKRSNNVNIQHLWEIIKENSIPYSKIDNDNVRELLEYIDENPERAHILSESQSQIRDKKYHYNLYNNSIINRRKHKSDIANTERPYFINPPAPTSIEPPSENTNKQGVTILIIVIGK